MCIHLYSGDALMKLYNKLVMIIEVNKSYGDDNWCCYVVVY